jgi:hypothetical protein
MKLNELAVANPTKQAAKVFESYFGKGMDFTSIGSSQARTMLKRVRNLIAEHRRTTQFHSSERNPAYLKLVVMEQALAARMSEQQVGMATATTAAGTGAMVDNMPNAQASVGDMQKQKAAMSLQRQQKQRELDDAIKIKQKEMADLQKQKSMMERRSLKQRLKEASEVQQAQVVLASQDMVDQVQKMSEQVSAMQFKDLPALIDNIKNEVGVDQAMQFNTDATAALAGLLQNLQGAKTQLEQALGVVTGQAPQVPGADMGADAGLGGEMPAELPAELPAPGEEEMVDTETEIEPVPSTLGRGRR